jgi:hypothetical protein
MGLDMTIGALVSLTFFKRLVVCDQVMAKLGMCLLAFFNAMMPLERTKCFINLYHLMVS